MTDPSATEADRGASSAAEVDAARRREKHRDNAFRDRDVRRRTQRTREHVDNGVEPLVEYCAAAIAR